MMKKSLCTYSLLALATLFTACSDNSEDTAALVGEGVNFSVSGADTRTIRDANSPWKIYWDSENDKVRIYCAESASSSNQVTNAVYTVKTESGNTVNVGQLMALSTGGLKWGSQERHTFYSVYPSDESKIKVNTATGKATIVPNFDQVCTIETTESSEASGYTYTAKPDMENSYMASEVMTTLPTKDVALTYHPIMTTLDITLENPENNGFVTVSGITVIDKATTNEVNNGFTYNLANRQIERETMTDANTASYSIMAQVRKKLSDGSYQHYLDLYGGQKVTLTVYLPPYAINADHTIDIKVNATRQTGFTVENVGNSATITGKDNNQASINLKAGELSSLKIKLSNSNTQRWMTYLDDNIYVQQLSIPGSNETMTADIDKMTQTLDLETQLKMGVRAFVFNTGRNSDDDYNYYLYHGSSNDSKYRGKKLSDALTTIKTFLTQHPGEFVVIISLRSFNTGIISNTWNGGYVEAFETPLKENNTSLNPASPYLIAWKKDLTVGECRGHVISMTRSEYTNWKSNGYTVSLGDYPDGSGSITMTHNNGTSTCYIYCKDSKYSQNQSTVNGKISNIENLWENYSMKASDASSDYFTKKYWTINYIGRAAGSDSQAGYIWNAQNVNLPIYNYLATRTTFGSLGIVLSDFVGVRDVDDSNKGVYGDLLTQAILDYNYKYVMQRKN